MPTKKIIFVTGHHRAGTHSAAEDIAFKNDLPWIDEKAIGLDNYDLIKALLDGYMPTGKKQGAALPVQLSIGCYCEISGTGAAAIVEYFLR